MKRALFQYAHARTSHAFPAIHFSMMSNSVLCNCSLFHTHDAGKRKLNRPFNAALPFDPSLIVTASKQRKSKIFMSLYVAAPRRTSRGNELQGVGSFTSRTLSTIIHTSPSTLLGRREKFRICSNCFLNWCWMEFEHLLFCSESLVRIFLHHHQLTFSFLLVAILFRPRR